MHRPPGVFLCLEAMCTSVDQGTSAKITRYLLTVYQTRSSLNICRQMALFEIVQTLILRFANMEKWINSLNLSTLIFRTLQYIPSWHSPELDISAGSGQYPPLRHCTTHKLGPCCDICFPPLPEDISPPSF